MSVFLCPFNALLMPTDRLVWLLSQHDTTRHNTPQHTTSRNVPPKWCQRGLNKEGNGATRYLKTGLKNNAGTQIKKDPKDRPKGVNGRPKGAKLAQKLPKGRPKGAKGTPKATNMDHDFVLVEPKVPLMPRMWPQGHKMEPTDFKMEHDATTF